MSAPPDSRTQNQPRMNSQNHQEQPRAEQQPSNVRVIPILVEGRDEPVINKSADHGTHFAEKPTYVPPPQQPHIDRDQYFADEGPIGYSHPPNFTRSFGAPYSKFRQGPQPFVHQKVYPQSAAFARGASPQRSQSPKPQHPDEHYVKVPVHHEQSAPKPEPPSKQQHQQPQQQPKQPPQQPPPPQQQPEPKQQTPPPQPKPQSSANDPITQILAIQTDVLNLMTDVENFKGTKKDKHYMFLDEMLTRNLIKLDNIETDGKENIRQARREAIKCIQKCIAVLEAKADNKAVQTPQPQEAEIKENEQTTENGEVEMAEPSKEEAKVESQSEQPQVVQEKKEEQTEAVPVENKEAPPQTEEVAPQVAEVPQAADKGSDEKTPEQKTEAKPEQNEVEKKGKKGGKNVKKRDKSKDNKDTPKDSNKEAEEKDVKLEAMHVDDKGDKPNSQTMEVDASSQ